MTEDRASSQDQPEVHTRQRDNGAVLIDQVVRGLLSSPWAAAAGLKAVLRQARRWAAGGDLHLLRPLADELDAAVEQLDQTWPRSNEDPATSSEAEQPSTEIEHLQSLAMLTRQVCVVLACLGDSQGVRDSGYWQAATAHAERLDAMTEHALDLVGLVNLVGDENRPDEVGEATCT